MMCHLFIFLFSNIALAESRTSLFKRETITQPKEIEQTAKSETSKKKIKNSSQSVPSNLPIEYSMGRKTISIEESPIVLPANRASIKFKGIKSGDLISATIQESIFAYADSKVPVRALISSGALKGSVFIGEASLEKNSKRIQIEFKKFRDPYSKDIFQILANVMDLKGIFGIEGKLISNESIFFAAELLSAGAAGYADSTISRDQNILGNSVDSKSEDTFAKKALTSALSRSADRFSEKLKQAPEYSILEGPIQIQILVLDQPALTQ